MTQIDNITDQADQITQVVLADGSILQIELVYRPAIQRWTFSVNHPLLVVNGINLCAEANLLRSWRNLVPFGLGCATTDGADPFDIDDFVNGRAQLYALNAADVEEIEASVYGGVLQ